jgi:hypothetical protein
MSSSSSSTAGVAAAAAAAANNDATTTTTTTRTSMTTTTTSSSKPPALVFGASGEQGRAVLEGFVDAGYYPVYAFSRSHHQEHQEPEPKAEGTTTTTTPSRNSRYSSQQQQQQQQVFNDQYLSEALGCILLTGDIANPEDVRQALTVTQAQAIFLVTTTDLPEEEEDGKTTAGGYKGAMDAERDVIVQFFQIVKEVHEADMLSLSLQQHHHQHRHRTVVFSTRDNVQDMCHQEQERLQQQLLLQPQPVSFQKPWVEPLEDGSIVPHYSGT